MRSDVDSVHSFCQEAYRVAVDLVKAGRGDEVKAALVSVGHRKVSELDELSACHFLTYLKGLKSTAVPYFEFPATTQQKEEPMFHTTIARTVGGYVGQIVSGTRVEMSAAPGGDVIWESSRVRKTGEKAQADAQKHLNNKIKELFQ